MSAREWVNDLAIGVRLAVGGGRTSLVRFALSTVGIAIAVAVLLVGASAGTMAGAHEEREEASFTGDGTPIEGVDPVYYRSTSTEFRGQEIEVGYVHVAGENHPLPAGVRALPGPGEVLASPALGELLASPEGELLRPRFPGPVVGTLGQEIVAQPGDLMAYVGADSSIIDSPSVQQVYEFGSPWPDQPMKAELLMVVLVGAVVLLLPVLIFVASASRIAGAERDRRLAALRLVGAGSRQVRRIAAAESLVSAVAGLVLGSVLFLVGRQYVDEVRVFDLGVYPSDITPNPVLAVLVVLVIPALAVLTALFALRRTVIEPLGVVRRSKPVRRRVLWRLAMLVAGVALVLYASSDGFRGTTTWAVALAGGVALSLVGVPVLLPWLVERSTGGLVGGPPSWQLAIRRLQLDSGTSARVVGGVAVVLAGAVALQTTLLSTEQGLGVNQFGGPSTPPMFQVFADDEVVDDVVAGLAAVPAVHGTHTVRRADGFQPGVPLEQQDSVSVAVLDCAAIREITAATDCVDGQVFRNVDAMPAVVPGQPLEFRKFLPYTPDADEDGFETVGTWTVPAELPETTIRETSWVFAALLVTPGALGDVQLPPENATVQVMIDNPTSDELEQMRNAAAQDWRSSVATYNTSQQLNAEQAAFLAIRNALYASSIVTLLLAGLGLLVLALEHIRERRRPLAVLAATGVRRGVLARSLLWQVAIPIALGVAVAVLVGLGLAWLILHLENEPVVVDWTGVGVLTAASALLSVLVTVLTLPFLRSATRLSSIRTE